MNKGYLKVFVVATLVILSFFVISHQAQAAVTFDSSSTYKLNAVTSVSWNHAVGSGSDRLLLVGISFWSNPQKTVSSVTYNGVALTQAGFVYSGSSGETSSIWYIVNPPTGTFSVVVNFAGGTVSPIVGATSWSGVDQTTPLGAFASAFSTSTLATVNVSSAVGEIVFDTVTYGKQTTPSHTVGANQTQMWSDATSDGLYNSGAGSREFGETTVTMSWTLGGSWRWAIGAISIKPSVGGVASTPHVKSPTATSITPTGVTLGANVTSDGGSALTARGTCWGTSANPTTNCAPEYTATIGVFTHIRDNMPSGTLIYYRGYATNSVGTGYSSDGTFTISSPALVLNIADGNDFGADTTPTLEFTGTDPESNDIKYNVQVSSDSNFGMNTAAVDGGDDYIRHDLPTWNEGGAGHFSVQYYQPWDALNRGIVKFTLPSGTATINKISLFVYNIGGTSTGANINVHQLTRDFTEGIGKNNVPSGTGATWNTYNGSNSWTTAGGDYNATVIDSVTDTGTGWKEFVLRGAGATNSLDSLTWGNTVGVLIKIQNESTTTQNNTYLSKEYLDSSLRPYIQISYAIPVLLDKVSGTDAGFADITNPVDTDPFASTNRIGFTVQSADALSAGTYYWRVRGKDPSGTNTYGTWSATRSFTVVGTSPPTVTSPTATSITSSGATIGANVTSDGGSALTTRGTCWDTTPSPTINCLAEGGTTTGIFTYARTGMLPGTLIYYRGYATNSVGTAYSADGSFTTLAAPTTTAVSPTSGINNASVSITSVTGTNFVSGATVKLTKATQTDISCTGFTFTNSTTLSTGSCPITGAATGTWNVVVTNPDFQTGTLTNGFTISNPMVSGFLVSSTLDTGYTDGVSFNSIIWKGSLGTGQSAVKFQLGSSNCSNGATDPPACATGSWVNPSSYLGPDGTSATFYVSTGPDVSAPIVTAYHNNKRYYRYKVQLEFIDLGGSTRPVVDDVIVNWSP